MLNDKSLKQETSLQGSGQPHTVVEMPHLKRWQKGAKWYLWIGLVILLGYVAGSSLWLAINVFNWLPMIESPMRRYIGYFGAGICGGAFSCNVFFKKDANSYLSGKSATPPNFVDPLGYALRIIEGGFMGVLLVAAVEVGGLVVVTAAESAENRNGIPDVTGLLLSFCGGLAIGRVRTRLANWVDGLFKKSPAANRAPRQASDHDKK